VHGHDRRVAKLRKHLALVADPLVALGIVCDFEDAPLPFLVANEQRQGGRATAQPLLELERAKPVISFRDRVWVEATIKSIAPVTKAEYRARISSSAVSLSRVPLMIGSQQAAKAAPDPHGQVKLSWFIKTKSTSTRKAVPFSCDSFQ
jgi:hypothetical protein